MLRNSIMLSEERKVKSEEINSFTNHKVQSSKFKVQSSKDMKYQYTVKGVDYEVEIQDIEGNIANVTVNGIPFEVEMKQPVKAGKQKVKLSGAANEGASSSSSTPQSAKASADLQSAASSGQTGNAGDAGKAATGKPVVAPLPGTINEIKVKVGDKVNAGDTVVILEAMKMQNNIEAETSGTITSINVNKGDAVMEGDTLVTIK